MYMCSQILTALQQTTVTQKKYSSVSAHLLTTNHHKHIVLPPPPWLPPYHEALARYRASLLSRHHHPAGHQTWFGHWSALQTSLLFRGLLAKHSHVQIPLDELPSKIQLTLRQAMFPEFLTSFDVSLRYFWKGQFCSSTNPLVHSHYLSVLAPAFMGPRKEPRQARPSTRSDRNLLWGRGEEGKIWAFAHFQVIQTLVLMQKEAAGTKAAGARAVFPLPL